MKFFVASTVLLSVSIAICTAVPFLGGARPPSPPKEPFLPPLPRNDSSRVNPLFPSLSPNETLPFHPPHQFFDWLIDWLKELKGKFNGGGDRGDRPDSKDDDKDRFKPREGQTGGPRPGEDHTEVPPIKEHPTEGPAGQRPKEPRPKEPTDRKDKLPGHGKGPKP